MSFIKITHRKKKIPQKRSGEISILESIARKWITSARLLNPYSFACLQDDFISWLIIYVSNPPYFEDTEGQTFLKRLDICQQSVLLYKEHQQMVYLFCSNKMGSVMSSDSSLLIAACVRGFDQSLNLVLIERKCHSKMCQKGRKRLSYFCLNGTGFPSLTLFFSVHMLITTCLQ